MSALSTAARREYYLELGHSLPAPPAHNREDHDRRLNTAIEAFIALAPADANEGRLAVQIVLCGAHAVECLRDVNLHREDFAKMTRCRTQAASLFREERAARRVLAQEQKARLGGLKAAQPEAASAAPQPTGTQAAPSAQSTARPLSAGAPSPARAATPSAAPAAPLPTAPLPTAPLPTAPLAAAASVGKHRAARPGLRAALQGSVFPNHPVPIDPLLAGTQAARDAAAATARVPSVAAA